MTTRVLSGLLHVGRRNHLYLYRCWNHPYRRRYRTACLRHLGKDAFIFYTPLKKSRFRIDSQSCSDCAVGEAKTPSIRVASRSQSFPVPLNDAKASHQRYWTRNLPGYSDCILKGLWQLRKLNHSSRALMLRIGCAESRFPS